MVLLGEIIVIALEVGLVLGVGRWFDEHLSRRVGGGTGTTFWWDPWLDEEILKSKFIYLFDLADNKMATTTDMNSLGWVVGDA